MHELEIITKCQTIFENLGWEVKRDVPLCLGDSSNLFWYDLVLIYNGEEYGFIEVFSSDKMERAKGIKEKLQKIIDIMKPRVFIITNGYAFDVYHYGEFYGTLTVPPAPEFVDILLGGEEDVEL